MIKSIIELRELLGLLVTVNPDILEFFCDNDNDNDTLLHSWDQTVLVLLLLYLKLTTSIIELRGFIGLLVTVSPDYSECFGEDTY